MDLHVMLPNLDIPESSKMFNTLPEVILPNLGCSTATLTSHLTPQLLGVWVYNEWVKMGKEAPLQLLELGPGRGTLVKDVLRVSGA